MATIRHINEAEYAAKALELLNNRREGYVNYTLSLFQQNLSPGQAGERLENKVKKEMETVLFDYLKHCASLTVRFGMYTTPMVTASRSAVHRPNVMSLPIFWTSRLFCRITKRLSATYWWMQSSSGLSPKSKQPKKLQKGK